jgi:hypothetical protein
LYSLHLNEFSVRSQLVKLVLDCPVEVAVGFRHLYRNSLD